MEEYEDISIDKKNTNLFSLLLFTCKCDNIVVLVWNAVNDGMSRRAVHKAIFESAALIGASALQVYLLRRLFERKLGTSRV